MVPYRRHITMIRGDTLAFAVRFKGMTADDSFDNIFFGVSRNLGSKDYVFVKSLNNGITRSTYPEYPDVYYVRVNPNDTARISPGEYFFELQANYKNDIFTVFSGNMTIIADAIIDIEEFMADNTAASPVNPEDYFQAVDGSPEGLSMTDRQYMYLATKMSRPYKNKVRYIKDAFVERNNKIYRAKQAFTPTSWASTDWEEMGDKVTSL